MNAGDDQHIEADCHASLSPSHDLQKPWPYGGLLPAEALGDMYTSNVPLSLHEFILWEVHEMIFAVEHLWDDAPLVWFKSFRVYPIVLGMLTCIDSYYKKNHLLIYNNYLYINKPWFGPRIQDLEL